MRRAMKIISTVAGLALAANGVAMAQAQAAPPATPKSWNYEIKDGKRVPKGQRQVNADGSWREELKQGSCVTVKEKSPSGEYKETRRCD